MQSFSLYFELGWQHILDLQGYDHILFITALCAGYLFADWKKVLLLVTAFTFGHSLTLALSVYNQILIPSSIIEFLIPLTIIITALTNIIIKKVSTKRNWLAYSLALLFGLIHGLGFSNYLKSLMGKSNNVVAELLAFNVGLELGQLIIVITVLILATLVITLFKVSNKTWNLFLSSTIFGVAITLLINRWPW